MYAKTQHHVFARSNKYKCIRYCKDKIVFLIVGCIVWNIST